MIGLAVGLILLALLVLAYAGVTLWMQVQAKRKEAADKKEQSVIRDIRQRR